jgi:hypothetical protein
MIITILVIQFNIIYIYMSEIQSVIFFRKYWTMPEAENWLKNNRLVPLKGVDLSKPKQYRYRIKEPSQFSHYITKKLKDHIDLVIGFKTK